MSAAVADHAAQAGLTSRLVTGIHDAFEAGVPDALVEEGRKGLLNALGLAIGASGATGVSAIVAGGAEPEGRPSRVPGRSEPVDLLTAATATAAAAHWEDFDDGHDSLRCHPGPSALGATLTVGAWADASARDVLIAHALSGEVQFRLAASVQPEHYAAGWHTTGTVGGIGAAIALGCLLRQPVAVIEDAVGLAVAQAAGNRQGFGTMMKPLNAGRAAASGVLAIRLAAAGVRGEPGLLEAPGGFLSSFSSAPDLMVVTEDLGTRWHFLTNTYKPYPCGRVVHPIIDAALELRTELGDPALLATAEIDCHPYVESLTGIAQPATGLETKFSAAHGLAVGLVRGQASTTEFTDEAAVDPVLGDVRGKTRLVLRPDSGPGTDVVTVRLTTTDGRMLTSTVRGARGTLARPLTFADIATKATQLIEPVLPGRGHEIAAKVEAMGAEDPIRDLTDLLVPHAGVGAS